MQRLVHRIAIWIALVPFSLAPIALAPSAAQEQIGSDGDSSGQQSLEQAASDPTASLLSIQIQDIYSGAFHLLDDADSNALLLRTALPFRLGKTNHIARLTLPYITDSPSGGSGFGDSVLFDLVVFSEAWGRWGVGPVLLMPTGGELGAEKWALGPALGFTASGSTVLWGLFNQNLVSFAGEDDREDVAVSILQPIVNVKLPRKWSAGTSEMTATYDWEAGGWSTLPLGVKLNKLVSVGKRPIQLSGSYEYNFQDDQVGSEWTVNLTVKFLFPL